MPSSRLPLRRYQTSVNNFFGMKTHSAESENAMNERCRHCGRRSTPPPTNTAPSLTSQEVETVINSLEKDLKRLLGNNEAKSYGAVKTAFLNWEKCNLDPVVHDETVKLQTLLREDYHFDAGEEKDIYRIPSSHSTQELNDYISSLILGFSKLKTGGKDKLLIVYYNGHGGVNPTTKNLDISGYGARTLMKKDEANQVIKRHDAKGT
ncbi:hypothetical protein K491DRAFT_693676 [Lophiostoma macrostomum CBS 122681]|uniref:Uncharacterized protein n=1 Tax=Lophiostoma macrostomum CBS 122681 TaxID=1314788 RepID=A0A6A6T3H8_9PLEO|nr:hypothetical protein K491DRAFT_693676 [Lophiostoma macrostomum CBS 122681]